jgi:hypothetical protein
MSEVRLVVQGDDFGMCHAVNTGVLTAFTEGILTQVSTMVPCPWFDEAAELARVHGIPAGIHSTLTCEWDYLRWKPLSAGPSLRAADGTFHRTVAEAAAAVVAEEAIAELVAQTEKFLAAGLTINHFDPHMGRVCVPAYEEVCRRYGKQFIYDGVEPNVGFDSVRMLSERDADQKKGWLLHRLEKLEPGDHIIVTHVATPGEELRSITGPESRVVRWAEEYRKSDLEVVCDPEVRQRIDTLGIKLVSVADL